MSCKPSCAPPDPLRKDPWHPRGHPHAARPQGRTGGGTSGDPLWDETLLFSISEGGLERILRYILHAEENVTRLTERIEKIRAKPLRTKTMTPAGQLRLQGKIEGKQEGLSEGQRHAFRTALLRALEVRHGAYPEGIREAVEALQDSQKLEGLIETAFRSDSIDTFAMNL